MTSATRHSPGPWTVFRNSLAVYSGSYSIANCTPAAVGAPHHESAANVRLIAAAPQLLYALQRVETALGPLSLTDHINGLSEDKAKELSRSYYAVTEAIALATGTRP